VVYPHNASNEEHQNQQARVTNFFEEMHNKKEESKTYQAVCINGQDRNRRIGEGSNL
jgi:hypothetical protein